jgi:hypothetical protein
MRREVYKERKLRFAVNQIYIIPFSFVSAELHISVYKCKLKLLNKKSIFPHFFITIEHKRHDLLTISI